MSCADVLNIARRYLKAAESGDLGRLHTHLSNGFVQP